MADIMVKCPGCGGTGQLNLKGYSKPRKRGDGHKPCNLCNGTGEVPPLVIYQGVSERTPKKVGWRKPEGRRRKLGWYKHVGFYKRRNTALHRYKDDLKKLLRKQNQNMSREELLKLVERTLERTLERTFSEALSEGGLGGSKNSQKRPK